jgi:hypothetical protein
MVTKLFLTPTFMATLDAFQARGKDKSKGGTEGSYLSRLEVSYDGAYYLGI